MRLRFVLALLLAVLSVWMPVRAQTTLTVTSTEPRNVDNASVATLSATGTGFTDQTLVRLVGFGFLTPTILSSTALTAAIPPGVPAGIYDVEISDPVNGTAVSPVRLIVTQQVTPIPLPTFPPTPEPTAVVGQPLLSVRSFNVTPATVTSGGQLSASVEVVNIGNLPAFGALLSVDPGGKFVPTGGASVTVPDLPPGGSAFVTLNMVAAMDAPEGANFIPLTLTFRDSEGRPLSSKASLSAMVQAANSAPLVTLLTYTVTPEIVRPGEIAVIRASVQNTGTRTANQVVIRLTSSTDQVLIAGPRGDAFPIGDIAPGATSIIDLPLFVAQSAKAGVQAQGFTLSHQQNGERVDQATALAVTVASVVRPRAIFLLDEVEISSREVKPGEAFSLRFRLNNVGTAPANDLLVVFGTVESSGNDDGGDNGSSTSVRPSAQFAPIGTGASQFVGEVSAGGGVAITQDFIASATLDSGIYALPITLRYERDDGTTATDAFSATVVVIGLPRLQVTFDSPLPDSVETFSAVPLAATFTNRGKNPVIIDRIEVTGEGIDVLDGASTPVGQLRTDEQTSVSATISPNVEGEFGVTFNIHYIDDLNRPQVLPLTYTSVAAAPPPPPEVPIEEPPLEPLPTPEPPPQEDLFSKLLLGFLGLGE